MENDRVLHTLDLLKRQVAAARPRSEPARLVPVGDFPIEQRWQRLAETVGVQQRPMRLSGPEHVHPGVREAAHTGDARAVLDHGGFDAELVANGIDDRTRVEEGTDPRTNVMLRDDGERSSVVLP